MATLKKAQFGFLNRGISRAASKKTSSVINRLKSAAATSKNPSSSLKGGKGGVADAPIRKKVEREITKSPGYKKFDKGFEDMMRKAVKATESSKKLKNLSELTPTKAQKNRFGGKIKPKASNVSKKLGSAKKSVGNMRFTKKKK